MRLLTIVLLFLAVVSASGQKMELGKVSIAELQEKVHPLDTSAAAAILFKKGKTHFTVGASGEWSVITEVQYRIKIYKKEGYEWANQEISYYTGGQPIKAYFDDAVTYNLVNGKIEETKLRSVGEFKEEINEEFSRKKITMPNVKEGSVIEFSHTVVTPYLTTLKDFAFQYYIPVNYVEYEIATPGYFSYDRYTTGYLKLEHTQPEVRYGAGALFKELVEKYWAENVKALREEAYVYNIENYLSSVKHELAATHFPSGDKKYSSDWASVSRRIYEHEDFGRELDFDSYYKEDLQVLLNPSSPPDEKLATLFNYVKTRMAWDGESSYLCEKGVKKAYQDKTGNAAEINLMLTAMLRTAGFKANPVLISTRSNGVALFPAINAYNYVVAGVETDKGIVVLDATSKFTASDQLPMRAMNWIGRMIRENGTTVEVDLSPKNPSKEVLNISAKLTADGAASGFIRDQSLDYLAYRYREKYAGMNPDVFMEKLEKQYTGLRVSDYKVSGVYDNTKPIVEEFNFEHSAVGDIIGDKIYLNPMMFYTETENPFTAETRDYPIDFIFPYQYKYLINIALPEGYVVESMPEAIAIGMDQNIGAFRYNIAQNGGNLQLLVVFDVNMPIVSQDYYDVMKDFFKKMIEKQNEKVILKKV